MLRVADGVGTGVAVAVDEAVGVALAVAECVEVAVGLGDAVPVGVTDGVGGVVFDLDRLDDGVGDLVPT